MEASGLLVLCSFHCVCTCNKQGKAGRKKSSDNLGRQGRSTPPPISFWKLCPKGAFSRIPLGELGEGGQAGTTYNLFLQHLGVATQSGWLFLLCPLCPPVTLSAVSTEWQKSRPSPFQAWEVESWGTGEGGKAPLGRGIPERAGGAWPRPRTARGGERSWWGGAAGTRLFFSFSVLHPVHSSEGQAPSPRPPGVGVRAVERAEGSGGRRGPTRDSTWRTASVASQAGRAVGAAREVTESGVGGTWFCAGRAERGAPAVPPALPPALGSSPGPARPAPGGRGPGAGPTG